MTLPLAIDLFCGLGGWTEGLLAEGYRVVGFDIERHCYPAPKHQGESAVKLPGNGSGDWKDRPRARYAHEPVETVDGRWITYPAQLVLQDVLTLHGSQFKDAALIVASPPCQAYSYRAMPWKRAKALPPPDNTLFEACFRIQREACEAAGHHIPLVVENVCGAQKWVGRARWHYGSFYLWGDVPALMPIVTKRRMKFPADCGPRMWSEREYVRLNDGNASAFHHEGKTTKNAGGSWFNVAHNTTSGKGQNPDGRKQPGIAGPRNNGKGDRWFQDGAAAHGSKSNARKAASAHIAKIPLPLAQWVARAWYPRHDLEVAQRRE